MKKITEKLREKIKLYIKNGLDISDLIEGYDIRGENLAGAIIKRFNRFNQDISYCNLARAIIGEENQITHLSRATMIGCNFKDAVFKGKVWLRKVNAQNCTFDGAFLPFVEYQHGDFRHSTFCDTIWRFGSRAGHGAIFDSDLILKKWAIVLK